MAPGVAHRVHFFGGALRTGDFCGVSVELWIPRGVGAGVYTEYGAALFWDGGE